jgi:hypothetical protein
MDLFTGRTDRMAGTHPLHQPGYRGGLMAGRRCYQHRQCRGGRRYTGCCCPGAVCEHGSTMAKDNCDWCIADRAVWFGKPSL